ncbi:hypothetical protein JAAARDRAFT_212042 [Jaapia argillacea MUCL 33604]|uniref:F-box domain-containing protein n=1 Tax=Jaapia argillacea MUCL 33604 TaxID=933084 RepID=A0A067P4A6_9AGAM|nr:hypothetical protein JAAARDRAFT_212042 [Jaapia argillacea MUCL 33604]
MHKAWNVLEIFEIIATFAGGGKLANVVSLALTCHDFTEPSLNIIWHTLPDIAPLIMCMPSDLWETERIWVSFEYFTMIKFRRSLVESDWERFDYYAPRVKELGEHPEEYHQPRRMALHPNVYRDLVPRRHPARLLQQLRNLIWKWPYDGFAPKDPNFCPRGEFITFALLFINPRLARLRIFYGDLRSNESLPPMTALLLQLPISCPNLEILRLHDLNPGQGLSQPLSQSLMGLHSLRSLTICTPLSDEAWFHLAGLPALEKVFANLQLVNGALPCIPLNPAPFRALSQVDLTASLDPSLPLLKSLRESPIVHISIILPTPPTRRDICRFIDILTGSERWRNTLNIIDISPSPTNTAEAQGALSPLQPLFVLKQVTVFRWDWPSFRPLNDGDLGELAQSWPKLRVLSMGYGEVDCTLQGACATLRGLVPLARHCPKLYCLRIPLIVKASDTIGLQVVAKKSRDRRNLLISCEEWRFCDQSNQELRTVAKFLRVAFGDVKLTMQRRTRLSFEMTHRSRTVYEFLNKF